MKYIAFYDTEEYGFENRSVAPSASSVVRYMAEVLNKIDNIEIISPSRTLNKKGVYSGRKIKLEDGICVIQPPTIGARTKVGSCIVAFFTRIWLFIYLLRNTERDEQIIVYHSLATMKIIKLISKLKHTRTIMEIREIYSDVISSNKKGRKKELKYFELADKYIFPTELLNRLINKSNKPYAVATGVYKSENISNEIWDDSKVHVVYAGTLQKEKGGALTAVRAAEFLSQGYHMHILGYGMKQDIINIKREIKRVSESTAATLTYDGFLRGEEFKAFIQKCHIGLSTQNSKGLFNATSFPSKVLTYLSNGLDVLSSRIAAVEESAIGTIVYYYDEQSPRSIADALQKIDISTSKNKSRVLYQLDKNLMVELKRIIEM